MTLVNISFLPFSSIENAKTLQLSKQEIEANNSPLLARPFESIVCLFFLLHAFAANFALSHRIVSLYYEESENLLALFFSLFLSGMARTVLPQPCLSHPGNGTLLKSHS